MSIDTGPVDVAVTYHPVKVISAGSTPLLGAIVWLAGLLEGEGSFTSTGGSGVRISLQMTDEDVVIRARDVSGYGKVVFEKPRKMGWKPTWRWAITGDQAEEVMRWVLPHMGIRRSEKIRTLLASRDDYRLVRTHKNVLRVQAREMRTSGMSLRQIGRVLGKDPQTIKNWTD